MFCRSSTKSARPAEAVRRMHVDGTAGTNAALQTVSRTLGHAPRITDLPTLQELGDACMSTDPKARPTFPQILEVRCGV